jgi:hypothetical protein
VFLMPNLGSTRATNAEFKAAGVPTDPTTITLTITAPDGTVTTPAPAHDGPGLYHYDIVFTQPGVWTAEWVGTGAVAATGKQTFTVPGASGEGPCAPWIGWDEIGEYCTPPDISVVLQDAVLMAATRTVWERSCKQFGLCTITRARVTPLCRHRYTWRAGYGYSVSGAYGGTLGLGSACGCGTYHYIDLGAAPVWSVDAVWIDGVPFTDYRVDDWQRLVRTDGNPWPPSQLQPAQGDPNTTEVSWTYGLPVPEDGKMAAALLACKYARESAPDCEPSSNATQITREGVSITIQPPKGDTGIVLVEQWLANFKCGGGGIFDAGAHKRTMRVGT